jgi:hypothetical protein
MAKPSSVASLREKALSFLRDDREPRDLREYRESRDMVRVSRDGARESVRGSKDFSATATAAGGARAERHIVDLAAEVDEQRERLRRGSRSELRRPATPSMNGLNRAAPVGTGEKRGLFGRLKGLVGKKGMERVDEA